MKKSILIFCLFALASCGDSGSSVNTAPSGQASVSASTTLEAILDSQTDAMKKRYEFRNPKETLEFFGIEPGMTVVEALPGGGWYTKLLVPFLGSEGKVVGANYAMGMWSFFGYKGERLDNMKKWPQTWPAEINDKSQSSGGASAEGFMFGDMPDSMKETADAVLATTIGDSQGVKDIVNKLKLARRAEVFTHKEVFRPWGSYESLVISERFQVKRIIVKAGHALSLQKHFRRAEHWVVVKGTAEIEVNNNKKILKENQSAYIPVGAKHRLSNPESDLLMMVEVQSGDYLGEDDIVRFEDIYGRSK